MAVVGVDFGTLHSKVCRRRRRRRLRTADPSSDRCCPSSGRGHHHQRSIEPSDAVCVPLLLVLPPLTLLPDPSSALVPSSVPLASQQRPRRLPTLKTPSALSSVSSADPSTIPESIQSKKSFSTPLSSTSVAPSAYRCPLFLCPFFPASHPLIGRLSRSSVRLLLHPARRRLPRQDP